MSVMQVCFKYSASLCETEGCGGEGGEFGGERETWPGVREQEEGAGSGRVWQKTAGRWHCCPWRRIQRWDGRTEEGGRSSEV